MMRTPEIWWLPYFIMIVAYVLVPNRHEAINNHHADNGLWIIWHNSYHVTAIKRLCWKGVNTLRPEQDGRHSADDSFTCIFFNENCCILIKFSLKYVRKGPIDNNRALVQKMAWRRSGDKPLSQPMMGKFGAHIYVSRPQWVQRWETFIVPLLFEDLFSDEVDALW